MGITASLLYNFVGIAPGASPRFSVLPVPYDLTSSYLSGIRNGPKAVIEASTHMKLYDEERAVSGRDSHKIMGYINRTLD